MRIIWPVLFVANRLSSVWSRFAWLSPLERSPQDQYYSCTLRLPDNRARGICIHRQLPAGMLPTVPLCSVALRRHEECLPRQVLYQTQGATLSFACLGAGGASPPSPDAHFPSSLGFIFTVGLGITEQHMGVPRAHTPSGPGRTQTCDQAVMSRSL